MFLSSSECTWQDHAVEIKSKVWNSISIISKLNSRLNRKYLQTTFFSIIRPILEYVGAVWENCTKYEPNKQEKI